MASIYSTRLRAFAKFGKERIKKRAFYMGSYVHLSENARNAPTKRELISYERKLILHLKNLHGIVVAPVALSAILLNSTLLDLSCLLFLVVGKSFTLETKQSQTLK